MPQEVPETGQAESRYDLPQLPHGRPLGDLTGLCAVVTGASSGIGRAIALEFARGGADLAIHCRSSRDALESVADECRRHGRACDLLQGDLSGDSYLPQLVADAWGFRRGIDIWVNNAGVDLLTGPAAQLDYADKLQRLFEVDVRATLLLSREVGRRMRAGRGGSILNIGWDQAERGMEGDSGELFGAAKSAVMAFSRSLAVSLAPKVRVNCIAPGWIRTAWGEQAGAPWQQRVLRETPLGRWGQPDDVARLARFLVSPDAAYLTGQVVNANAGAVR